MVHFVVIVAVNVDVVVVVVVVVDVVVVVVVVVAACAAAPAVAEWSERLTFRRLGWLGAAAVGSMAVLASFSLSGSQKVFSYTKSLLYQRGWSSSPH